MNNDQLIAFVEATQEAMLRQQQLLQAQGHQIVGLHSKLSAVRHLAYALAESHPNPHLVQDRYLSLMDRVADRLQPEMAQVFQDDMQVVLRELLALRPGRSGSAPHPTA
jgi:hypothetical protein